MIEAKSKQPRDDARTSDDGARTSLSKTRERPPVAPEGSSVELIPISRFIEDEAGNEPGDQIAAWVRNFLTRPHVDLGRIGDVCPFTSQASRLDTVRIGVCDAGPDEGKRILEVMEDAVRAFDAMPCPKAMRHFRTIMVGFPNCADEAGLKVLKQIQNDLARHSIYLGKMIGFFEPNAADKGLINPDFRPMRSPIPLIAIRVMVDGDASFVIRNPKLTPVYLAKFPWTGLPKLWAMLRR